MKFLTGIVGLSDSVTTKIMVAGHARLHQEVAGSGAVLPCYSSSTPIQRANFVLISEVYNVDGPSQGAQERKLEYSLGGKLLYVAHACGAY